MTMKHIAVVLESLDHAEHVACCLEAVARPGARVTFLLPAKARRAVWTQARMTGLAAHQLAAATFLEQRWHIDIDQEQRVAERLLSTLRDFLFGQDIETELRVYTGSLKRALHELGGGWTNSVMILRPRKDWLAVKVARSILRLAGVTSAGGRSKASLKFFWHAPPHLPLATKDDGGI